MDKVIMRWYATILILGSSDKLCEVEIMGQALSQKGQDN